MTLNWNRIIIRYLTFGALGSILIIVGTYFLARYEVDISASKEKWLQRIDESRETVTTIVQDYLATTPSETNKPPDTQDMTIAESKATNNTPTVAHSTTTSPVQVTQTTAPIKPPPAAGHWGVVKNVDAKTYNRAGKFLRTIPPGTLVDIAQMLDASVGKLAVCRILFQDAAFNDIVIRASDLNIRPGPLTAADPKEKDLRILHAQLLGQIKDKEKELVVTGRKDNPYAAEYRRIDEQLRGFEKKAADLLRKRDDATGTARMEYSDQLRMMKGDDIRLMQAHKAVKQKYDDWNKQHANAPVDDPQLSALRGKLAEIENELRSYN